MANTRKSTSKALQTRNMQKKMTQLASLLRGELAGLMGQQFGGNRDLYDVLGYRRKLEFANYMEYYERGDIAPRVVDAPPEATWRRPPLIHSDLDSSKTSPFEEAWESLVERLHVYHYMERADKLAGIGQYGCLLIGTADVRNADGLRSQMSKLKGPDSVLYLTPFTEDSAAIAELDRNPASKRFGLPLLYTLTVESPKEVESTVGFAADQTLTVHWSRVIHIAEGLQENNIIGTPRLKKIFNRLYDVEKIAGGSAEIFWQAAKRIMVLQAKDGFSAVDNDNDMADAMEELVHGLRRVIDVQGYEVKQLEQTDVKPREAFEVAMSLIASATGIPQRILLGSEQGKMASEQDEANWNAKIAYRQRNYAEQVILRPFIDRLIEVGALPKPTPKYTIVWPSLFEMTDKEKGQIGILKARAIEQYVGKMGENLEASQKVCTVEEFRTEILNLPAAMPESEIREVELPEPVVAPPAAVGKPAVPAKE